MSSTNMSAIRTAKRDLRNQIRTALSSVTADSLSQQSATVTSKLLELPEYRDAKRISVYLSMPYGEISTRNIVQDAISTGKQVFIPYIHTSKVISSGSTSSTMDMLALNSMLDFESLQPDKWGIPSINPDTASKRRNCFGGHGISSTTSSTSLGEWGLDLIVMPGLAFDSDLRRLGHGKGYYDNFLNRYAKGLSEHAKASRKPFLVALALNEQMLSAPDAIPVEKHDWPMNRIIIGNGESIVRT